MLGPQYRCGPVPQGHILAKYRLFNNWTEGDHTSTNDLMRLEDFDAR
jgi:hypothetical protein